MCLRPLGIDHFGSDELSGRRDQGGLLRGRRRQQIGSGQRPSRFDTDGSDRVAEERSDRLHDGGWGRGRQGARDCGPDEGAGSAIAAFIAGSEAGVAYRPSKGRALARTIDGGF